MLQSLYFFLAKCKYNSSNTDEYKTTVLAFWRQNTTSKLCDLIYEYRLSLFSRITPCESFSVACAGFLI